MIALPLLLVAVPLIVPDDESKALARFRHAYLPARETAEALELRRAALTSLRPFDSPKVAEALMRAYHHLEQEALPYEERRRPLLEQGGGKKLLPHRLALRPIRELQDGILAHIAGLERAETLRSLFRAMLRSQPPQPLVLRLAIADRAAALATRDRRMLIQATGRAKSREEIVLLLRALGRLGASAHGAGPWIVARLEHRSELVRERASDALAEIAWPDSLEPLIARVELDEGRPQRRAARALEILTRVKLGLSAPAWRRWLAREGGPFVRGEVELGGGESHIAAQAAGGYYFGIAQEGRSILYVYDSSQSMRNPLGRRRGEPKPAQRETRIERSRSELKQAIAKLTPGVRFNIIAYANGLFRFERELQRATPESVARAQAWLDALPLKFGTNTHDALELAFLCAGRGASDRYYEPEIDTMFLLSDGLPTIQQLKGARVGPDKPNEILSGLRRWNPLGRITVHTIGLSMNRERAREFMQQVAKQNGGTFKRFP